MNILPSISNNKKSLFNPILRGRGGTQFFADLWPFTAVLFYSLFFYFLSYPEMGFIVYSYRIGVDFPPFCLLGFGVIFRHSIIPSGFGMIFCHSAFRIWGDLLPFHHSVWIWNDFPPFCLLGFGVIFRHSIIPSLGFGMIFCHSAFRIWGDLLPFLLLGFGVIFRRSVSPSFRIYSTVPAFVTLTGGNLGIGL